MWSRAPVCPVSKLAYGGHLVFSDCKKLVENRVRLLAVTGFAFPSQ